MSAPERHVYLVHHLHELPGGEEDWKLIGCYSSRSKAEAAVVRAQALPGFRDTPGGFVVDRHVLNSDHWADGFETLL